MTSTYLNNLDSILDKLFDYAVIYETDYVYNNLV